MLAQPAVLGRRKRIIWVIFPKHQTRLKVEWNRDRFGGELSPARVTRKESHVSQLFWQFQVVMFYSENQDENRKEGNRRGGRSWSRSEFHVLCRPATRWKSRKKKLVVRWQWTPFYPLLRVLHINICEKT